MDLDLLTTIILEQQANLAKVPLVKRHFNFEAQMNYVLVGLRRAGKSFLMYQRIQELLASGVDSRQIIYINFEDERLIDFSLADFNSILVAANQLSDQKHYYFFDEIQNIDGWERFARRMADQKEFVYITGSNSKMLGQDIILRLGGRYLIKYVSPFTFSEYLSAKKIPHSKVDRLITSNQGKINSELNGYLQFGGLPESIDLLDKRNYLNDIYQNIYLADIIVRNNIRNPEAFRLMMKKISETVMHEVSFNKLYKSIKSLGISIGKNSPIEYTTFAQNAYLLFVTKNYFSKFTEKESTPRYYFTDNGLLNIFLVNKNATLLENLVAVTLFNQFHQNVYYLKSNKTGIDIDFYVAKTKTAIQVSWSLGSDASEREINNLVKLKENFSEVEKLIIVTKNDSKKEIKVKDTIIQVVPLMEFLLA